MKRTIEIEDSLQDRTESAIDEVKTELFTYLSENEPDEVPDLNNDLDYDGVIHEIVDRWVPIYTKEINDTWYLHRQELVDAYEDTGIGKNSMENDGMCAIYCYIMNKVQEWYHDNANDIFEEFLKMKFHQSSD